MKTALIVEGGGMRGIYAAGVLDAFMEEKYDPFDMYFGVSAGACNLASHLAGQHRRNYRIYTELMVQREFINFKRFLFRGHWMDLDWLWETLEQVNPLDTTTAISNISKKKKQFLVTVTSADSGLPLYLTPGADNLNDYLKASSALPVLYRNMIEVEGRHVVDGGVGDPIPVIEAYKRGARKIMVIRTREASYRKRNDMETRLSSLLMKKYPALKEAIRYRPVQYNRAVQFLEHPPKDVEVLHVAPDTMETGRLTRSLKSLNADYERGRIRGREIALREKIKNHGASEGKKHSTGN
ncbi:MAG TPA: patatin family protein [Spirochaetota bacterium]|nr:patatin family protein [Spirochaetota bacterium]HPQ54867.1 patatin family protein [Spirochaetota bacterium]